MVWNIEVACADQSRTLEVEKGMLVLLMGLCSNNMYLIKSCLIC